MFPAKSKELALTFVLYTALALSLASPAEASPSLYRRDYAQVNRMAKRAPQALVPAIIPATSTNGPTTATTARAAPTTADTATGPRHSVTETTTTTGNTPLFEPPLFGLPIPPDSSAAATETATTQTSTGTAALTTTTSSSSSSTTTSTTKTTSTTPRPTPSPFDVPSDAPADVTVTSTSVAAADPTQGASNAGTVSTTSKTVLTVLIASAASLGALVIIWTIIKKWKFNKSESFDDRLLPVGLKPGLETQEPKPVGRQTPEPPVALYRSSSKDRFAQGGMDTSFDPRLNHDFTAGATQAAGGYADMARSSAHGNMAGHGAGYRGISDPFSNDFAAAAPQPHGDYSHGPNGEMDPYDYNRGAPHSYVAR